MFDPHPTLSEIIAAHEAARAPVAISDRAGLTDAGHAVVAGHRFVRALCALPPEVRAVTLADFASEIRDVIHELASA